MGLFDAQFSRRPNKYPWTKRFIEAMRHGFWSPDEFNFSSDKHNFYHDLTTEEQEVIIRTLTAIGQIEIAVKSFWGDLGKNLPHPYISDLGFTMANIEVIHNDAYEKLIVETLGLEHTFEEFLKDPVLLGRATYLKKYNDKVFKDERQQYIYAIILFTLFVENVSLFTQFYIILWFNRFRNVLKDTAQQIQYTRNEETLHAQIGIKLINTLREEYPELFTDELNEKVEAEIAEAYLQECRVIDWILQGFKGGDNLNPLILKVMVCNRLYESAQAIGFHCPLTIHDDNDELLWFDEELLGNNMSDFFHKRPTEYTKSNRVFDEEDLF